MVMIDHYSFESKLARDRKLVNVRCSKIDR